VVNSTLPFFGPYWAFTNVTEKSNFSYQQRPLNIYQLLGYEVAKMFIDHII